MPARRPTPAVCCSGTSTSPWTTGAWSRRRSWPRPLSASHRVISSPLQRCRQTADAIGAPVEVDDRWIELDYGEFDGQPMGAIGREVWDRWRADPRHVPAGGESLADAVRTGAARPARNWRPTPPERDVVVVSHVSPIKAAVAWALGAGVEIAWRSHLDPASISRITIGANGPVLRSFNETFHLDQ